MAFRWTAALTVTLLLGCGGRARGDGPPNAAAGGPSDIAGAANEAPAAGGDQASAGTGPGSAGGGAFGGGSTINALDDENRADGAPLAPFPGAIFWQVPGGSWKLGNWFLTSDGVQDVGLSPIEPPRDGSTQGRHVSGDGFPAGVVLWLQLDHPVGGSVDLSAYAGLTFWARMSSSDRRLDVLLNDGSTAPAPWTGVPPAPYASVAIGSEWQKVELSFEALGVSAPEATSIDFHVGDGGKSYDLWIDDLSFFCVGPCP
jgi:hypothetical protein